MTNQHYISGQGRHHGDGRLPRHALGASLHACRSASRTNAALNALHTVRDLIAAINGIQRIYSNEYEHDSRTLSFESAQAHALLRQRLHGKSTDDYYLIAATTPGVAIGWQTSTQQLEQPAPASVTERDAGLAAAVAQRSGR